jgi:hypothetical protein
VRALLAPLPPLLDHLGAALASSRGPPAAAAAERASFASTGGGGGGVSGGGPCGPGGGGGGDLSVDATRALLVESAAAYARQAQGGATADEHWLPQKVRDCCAALSLTPPSPFHVASERVFFIDAPSLTHIFFALLASFGVIGLPYQVCYQEQAEPEAFFVPYAWEVAVSHTLPDLLWGHEALA